MAGWDDELKNLSDLLASDKGMRAALSTVLAVQKQRIYLNGQAANGSKIGQYSTKKASIGKKQQASNTGKTYFKGGYAEYKSDIGKNPGYVVLRNTDQEMMDYGVIVIDKNTYGLGFQNDLNYNKTQWHESHFNKTIFDTTDVEDEILEKVLNDYLERNL